MTTTEIIRMAIERNNLIFASEQRLELFANPLPKASVTV